MHSIRLVIELRERTGARAAALERMLYCTRIYAYACARTSDHDVYVYLVAGVGESPTGDARAFCATYFGGERLAPCRAGVVCTVTETTHTTSRKENGGEERGGGAIAPPAPPPPDPPLGTAYSLTGLVTLL